MFGGPPKGGGGGYLQANISANCIVKGGTVKICKNIGTTKVIAAWCCSRSRFGEGGGGGGGGAVSWGQVPTHNHKQDYAHCFITYHLPGFYPHF